MLPGRRLSLLALCVAGCASQLLVVPDSDWQTVPPVTRSSVDHQHEVDLAAARTELAAAKGGLAELQRVQGAARAGDAPTAGRTDPDADEWGAMVRDHQQARIAAYGRIETARLDVARTDRAWRELRVEVAETRIDMVISERELRRAQAIDRNLLGSDHYDTAPLRGQFSRAQQRWHAAATKARAARIALDRASTTMASAKEAYAQLMRNGPAQLGVAAPPPSPQSIDERARLELSAWTVNRTDIARRRGLRHFLDTVSTSPPTLRKKPFKLSPAPRPPRDETPTVIAAPAAAPAPAATRAPAPAAKSAPPASPKPWDTVEPAGPAARKVAAGATPAPTTPPPATTPAPAATTPSPAPATPLPAPALTVGPQPMGPVPPPGGITGKAQRANARATRPAERSAPATAKPVQAPTTPAPPPR